MALVNRYNRIHPWKFALWCGCASITMMFVAWTSAYVVRHAAGNWVEFRLPNMFFVSTAIIIASSLALQWSYSNFKRSNENSYKLGLIAATILGFMFIALQYMAWQQLKNIGIPLTLNPSGDFIYVFTGFHAAHVLGGIAVLIVALIHAFSLKFNPTPKRVLRYELTLTYWHFVDLLWVYLLSFFLLQS